MSTSEGSGPCAHGYYSAAIVTLYHFVQLDTSECDGTKVAVETAGAGGQIFGISADTSAAGGHVAVFDAPGRVCYLTVDGNAGAISVGSYLKADSSGHGVATTSAGDECGAIALEASTAAGDIISVMTRFTESPA